MNPISDHPPFRSPRPARGKVGRLPDTVRQTVNLMLIDGEPYTAIIERLATLGHPGFTPHNISRWKLAGHQRWLDAQEKFDLEKLRAESSAEAVKQFKDPSALADASEMLLAVNIFRALREIQHRPADELLNDLSNTFIRLAHISNRQIAERTRRERLQFHQKSPETEPIDRLLADPAKLARVLNEILARCSLPAAIAPNRG